jgi:NAD-dependent SIR2 family protein deacetylase
MICDKCRKKAELTNIEKCDVCNTRSIKPQIVHFCECYCNDDNVFILTKAEFAILCIIVILILILAHAYVRGAI